MSPHAEPTWTASSEPGLPRSPHALVLVDGPSRAWTILKITGLVAVTALSTALATAIILGGALFAVLTIG